MRIPWLGEYSHTAWPRCPAVGGAIGPRTRVDWLRTDLFVLRLQKLLAGAGHGSRRAIEEWIRAGRITVNGKVAQLGDRATPGDDVRLDGKPLSTGTVAKAPAVLLYNKPVGEVTTRADPQGRPT